MEELALVDHPTGLLPWEMRFVQEYADSGQFVDSMKRVCAVHELGKNDRSLRMKAVALLKRPAIKKYLRACIDRLDEFAVMGESELRIYLTSVIRTPVGAITEDDPLAQEVTTFTKTNQDGSQSETKVVKGVSKLAAAQALMRMNGWDAPVKVDVNHTTGGVMLIPMAESMTDWEKAAAPSQAKLMADAINI